MQRKPQDKTVAARFRKIDRANFARDPTGTPVEPELGVSLSEAHTPHPGRTPAPSGSSFRAPIPSITFNDLAGLSSVENALYESIVIQFEYPDIFAACPTAATRVVLLHGASGTGKTSIAAACASACAAACEDVSYFKLAATEIVTGVSGDSEARLRQLFVDALAAAPAVIFIDDIDIIAGSAGAGANRKMETRIVAQLGASIETLASADPAKPVVLLAATSRISAVDMSLRREGRFSREIQLPIPDVDARAAILGRLTSGARFGRDVHAAIDALAIETPGYVGSDLVALVREATLAAIRDEIRRRREATNNNSTAISPSSSALPPAPTPFGGINTGAGDETPRAPSPAPAPAPAPTFDLCVHLGDFLRALREVQPTAQREGFGTCPGTTWQDIGALSHIQSRLSLLFAAPIHHRAECEALGLSKPAGVLLSGPPGCGKTLIAKAIANASGCSFISVKGPELLNKYVGESERAVRSVFERARASEPCIVFFDELDSLVPARAGGENQAAERVVNQFLTELDGAGTRGQVFVLGATNRPDLIDKALLRNGRFGEQFFVPLPDSVGRMQILRAMLRSVPLDGRSLPPRPAPGAAAAAVAANAENVAPADVARAFAEAGFKTIFSQAPPLPPLPAWLDRFGGLTEGFSGADLGQLVDGARRAALGERLDLIRAMEESGQQRTLEPVRLCEHHFEAALGAARPSVSPEDRVKYERLRMELEGHVPV